jgi:vacuolar-type H+-ATPase subunit E/Vma4
MDGRDELIARIRQEGRQRVAEIDAERDRAVEELRGRSAREIEALEHSAVERTQREAAQVVERARSEARLSRRNARLTARWRSIERVVDDAVARLKGEAGYGELLAALVRQHAPAGSTVVAAAADVAGLRSAGVKVEPGSMNAGAVISVGKRDLNFSIEAVSGEVREAMVSDIARVLFSDK